MNFNSFVFPCPKFDFNRLSHIQKNLIFRQMKWRLIQINTGCSQSLQHLILCLRTNFQIVLLLFLPLTMVIWIIILRRYQFLICIKSLLLFLWQQISLIKKLFFGGIVWKSSSWHMTRLLHAMAKVILANPFSSGGIRSVIFVREF